LTSLAFREDDRFLAAASLSPTVHVFRLDARENAAIETVDASTETASSSAAPTASAAAMVGGAPGAADVVGDVVEVMRGAIMPNYFNDQKSFAQFRIPDMDGGGRAGAGQAAVDVRAACSTIYGPEVGFRGREPVLLVLHHSGVLYEVAFREDETPSSARNGGTQECYCSTSSMWFASRPDFRVHKPSVEFVPADTGEGDDTGEAWQLL